MSTAAKDIRERHPYRMKDLCEDTGLTRQTIHYYIQQGLLPAGHKTSPNMAWYAEEHLERLHLIQRLQRERFLPLEAIKAIFDGDVSRFDPDQRRVLRQVGARLRASRALSAPAPDDAERVDARALVDEAGVELEDVRAMAELGLTVLLEATEGGLELPARDAWLIRLWGQVRAAGITSELGFEVADLALYAETISALFEREQRALLERLLALPPERIAALLERGLPLIHSFLAQYHTAQVRNFFAALETP